MANRLLSQEEIDALLKNEPLKKAGPELTREEKDALGEIGNIAMGTAATTLSQLIGRKVRITTPQVSLTSKERLAKDYPIPHLAVEVEYNQGLEGNNLLVIREKDAQVIAQLMLGQEPGGEVELDEICLSALGEAMNQMMGSAATAISTIFQRVVNISPPRVKLVDFTQEEMEEILTGDPDIVKVSFQLSVEGLVESEIMQLIPLSFAKEMAETLLKPGSMPGTPPGKGEEQPEPEPEPEPEHEHDQPVIQPVQFAPLEPEETEGEKGNIDLLLDIPLEVTVELGRTRRMVKEVLELGVGSLLELDKLAGEPVDILVNGKLIAKGEVVVVGENFGVRVTEIAAVQERVKTLQ